ncbi:MAG TPA: hypothetical protein VF115_00235 [Acidimicrobiia bacterium]
MVKVYAIVLVLGIIGLLIYILGGALAENLGKEERGPDARFGLTGKLVVGATVGFGMGGMSAEFSPLDLSWPIALLIALVAAGLSVFWVRYAVGETGGR